MPIMTSDLVGHCGKPPALPDCSLISIDLMKNGMPVMIMTTASGSRKNACPITSMLSRTRFGNMLFTMSMRMCSLASSVQGEHSRNTMLNRIHCSSSQEFDEVSKTLRTVALIAETITAARISHARRLPSQMVMASTTRVAGSNAFSIASRAPTCFSPLPDRGDIAVRCCYFSFCPHGLAQGPSLPP